VIRLNLAREPVWLDLGHGVRVHALPVTSAIMLAARVVVASEIIPDGTESRAAHRADAIIRAVGRATITAWEGVGDASGAQAPVTPEGIDALLSLYPLSDAFERAHMAPAYLLSAEKNASTPSPNGISAGA